jgi:branched-chain amino acid transport system ATP-binding protein
VADTSFLKVEQLDVRYGPAKALFEVSIEAEAGTMLALLGPNGAGKSSLARALSGLIPVTSGKVHFDGMDVTNWSPHRRQRAGLTYIPEGRGIFPGLSVLENLKMAARTAGTAAEREKAIAKAMELFPVLGERQKQRAGSLSGGEQQMLALARALAVEPKLIIADEMSLGLAPLIVDVVFEGLDKARKSGITVILIEQFIHRALTMADTCVILSRGHVAWSGKASDAGPEVLDSYLGQAAAS